MRILQIVFDFLPESIGGTEVYVAGLAGQLVAAGHEVVVVVPTAGHMSESRVDGVRVVRASPDDTRELARRWSVDIVHCHPLTGGDVLRWLESLDELGVPIVCTYHTPTLTCGRGDLLFMGRTVCDGRIDEGRCARCVLQQKGIPASLCEVARQVSLKMRLPPQWVPRRVRSMASIPAQRNRAVEGWRRLASLVDHWVAPSRWTAGVLAINGVSSERMSVIRQGVARSEPQHRGLPRRLRVSSRLVAGYLGRLHGYKGIETLLNAIREVEDPRLEIRIAGTGLPEYVDALRRRTMGDSRIHWIGRLQHGSTPAFLRDLDVLVVPSIWMETGPMTILEAWAEGTPVIGSDRGGIAEWLAEYAGGLAFPAADSLALANLLQGILDRRLELPRVPDRIRTMGDVCAEMLSLYMKVRTSHG